MLKPNEKELLLTPEEWSSLCAYSRHKINKFIAEKEAAVKQATSEHETILGAWHKIFGTTQLSHASERLNHAEREVVRLKAVLKQARADVYAECKGIAQIRAEKCDYAYQVVDEIQKAAERAKE